MSARRIADVESRPIKPVKTGRADCHRRVVGSVSRPEEERCKFFPANEPLPVGLSLHLDMPVEGGIATGREQLNQDILLIRPQDPNFAGCWFSRPLDFASAKGNPAFWMLEKTGRHTWLLCLRRGKGEVAAYHLNTRRDAFPITLKKGRVSKEFTNWPRTITVRWA
jgi:hypothetical protein